MPMDVKQFFVDIRGQIISLFYSVKTFIDDSRTKLKNLYQTNYNTGIYHLEHGNLWDATFRFKIIKRYWPDQVQAQYMYAYCLALQNMNIDAKNVLSEVLEKQPNYEEAKYLLKLIKNGQTQKIISEYNDVFNKSLQEEQKNNNND